MKIGDCDLSLRPLVVAEIGANHEGDLAVAKRMIREAAQAGADAVKFQTYQAEKIIARTEQERFAHFQHLALPAEAFADLAAEAQARKVLFLSTPFDLDAVELLDPLVPAFKIASGDITCLPLIERIAHTGKPIFLSTGMATLEEIAAALNAIRTAAEVGPDTLRERVVLLHCVSSYPTAPEEANLRAMLTLRKTFGLPVGYSDHTVGILACLAAASLGACVLEKHFTLDKSRRTLRDHQLSADANDLTELTAAVKCVAAMLGSGVKAPMPSEEANRVTMRRSVAARVDIKTHEVLSERHLTVLRPATGVPPSELATLIGQIAQQDIPAGSVIPQGAVARPPERTGAS